MTLRRLLEELDRVELPVPVRESLSAALLGGRADRIQDLPAPRLKELTGLPPTKALRALCVWFDLVEDPRPASTIVPLGSVAEEILARPDGNAFDVLQESDSPSLLDLGAGDLSFADEVAQSYGPVIRQRGRTLVLHCVDRLHPQSRLGGPLHPDQQRLQELRARPDISFRFFPDQDMLALEKLDRSGKLAPCYTVASCWAPATPTFAYEPTRINEMLIREELRRTKGTFYRTEFAGEPALEVQHGGRALLFPPWKFEVRGPLALLDVLSRRGQVCVLGAVDDQVFWELLAQLLDESRFRPVDQPFTSENIPSVFDEVFQQLSRLPIGASIDLALCGTLRREIPRVLPLRDRQDASYRFRSVQIRRGAEFPGIPASSTARRFRDMVEETPPWMVVLLPDL
jgi:hypothetical protein